MESPQTSPRPDNYLVWAILATLFCCLPFGIVAIVKSSKVNSLYDQGLVDEAYRTSAEAKNWCYYALFAGIASMLIYLIAMFIQLGGM